MRTSTFINDSLVSVIIPTYNRAGLISETLESVLHQTFLNWECLIIDDNSTDETSQIVQAYCSNDSRFQYYLNERSKGAQGARNTGIDKSKGKFLIFLDSDDLLAPFCLERRLQFAKENPDKEFYCFATALFKQKPGDTQLLWNYLNTNVDDIVRFLRQDMPWHTSGVLWKKEKVVKIKDWDEQINTWQDWDFHVRALIEPDCRYIKDNQQKPDSFYRIESDKNAISKKWISESSKKTYVYLIHKFVNKIFFKSSPYKFELSKLSFRLSRIIYENIDKKEGIKLFWYGQSRLGYLKVFSLLWIFHIIFSKQNNPYLLRKLSHIIPRLFSKSKLTDNKRTHLKAGI